MHRKMLVIVVVLAFAGTMMAVDKPIKKVDVHKSQNEVNPGHSAYKPANIGAKQNLGDSVFCFSVEDQTGDNQILGVEFDGMYFWLTGGNSGNDPNKLYKFDAQGNLIATYDQPSHATGWGLRDLAWDGQYLYGSASSIISQIDPATGQEVGQLTGPESPNRALAYDPVTDHFWTANFSSSIYEFDRNGNVINTYSNSYSIYGMAWDDVSPDGPWIWVAAQEDNGTGGNNYIYQFDPRTGTYTGIGFPVSYSSPTGIAGGLAFTTDWDPAMGLLFEIIQGTPDVVIGMYVTDAGDSLDPRPPSNVSAYSDYTTPTQITLTWTDPTHYVGGDTLTNFNIEIWRSSGAKDSTLIATVASGVQTYTDNGLTDGTLYTYYLRAVDNNDSTSSFVQTSWYAGGSPYPAPPQNLMGNVIDETHVELTWINPSTQSDGTPLDDLAGINIYLNGTLYTSYSTSAVGLPVVDTVELTPGVYDIYVTAFDNETPVHESDPSNMVHVVTNAHAGGPDGFGYTFMDSDYQAGPEFQWIDITTTGTQIPLRDDDWDSVALSFPFPFYDATYQTIDIQSNGTITFHHDYFGLSNRALPTNAYSGPWDLIAFYWSDQNPSSSTGHGAVYFQDFGDSAVVEFYEVPEYGGSTYNTYEVVLYSNGNIRMNYLTITDYSDETIGIQDASAYPSGDWYLQYTYNGDPIIPHDSLSVLFYYPVAVGEDNNLSKYMLMGTATNPVRGFSTITFAVPRSGNVNLSLYDIMGRKVKDIFSGRVNAGKHTVRFDATGLAGGVYFVKMVAGDYTGVAKVLVVR